MDGRTGGQGRLQNPGWGGRGGLEGTGRTRWTGLGRMGRSGAYWIELRGP